MKVIFLDVDGVLNHRDTPFTDGEVFILDDDCIRQLQRIVAETDAEIVLSSSWKFSPKSVSHLAWKLMNEFGMIMLDKTPNLQEGLNHRHFEIRKWLEGHDVTQIAILDDDADACIDEQRESFFMTSFQSGGLTEEIADAVIEHLNNT